MELYVLDDQMRRVTVIDSFISCVWTERYNDVGDLTLNMHSTLANRNLLVTGTMLAMNKSNRVMMVETVEDKTTQEGSQELVVTGSSLEYVMEDRVARDSLDDGTTNDPSWAMTGLPASLARGVFQTIMIDGQLDVGDKLPFYHTGNLYPTDNIAEPADPITINVGLSSVLSAMKQICQTYDLGFRLCRNYDTSQIFFNVYSGNDRTSGQTVLPAVVFGPNLDNLMGSSYLTSMKQYKNVAYVFCPDGTAKVYDEGIDPSVAGFSRHVLMVNATDITFPDRTIGPVYVVPDNQLDAVKAAQALTTTTSLQKASYDKIPGLDRLWPQDVVNINTVIVTAFSLTTSQATSAVSAQSKAGVTQDQKNALITLAALGRVDSSGLSALNTMLANNVALTSTEKTDIPAALANQKLFVTPAEKTLIQTAVTVSQAYEPTEDAALNDLLTAKGLQELKKYNNITAFDGEVPQFTSYKYEIDYYLGDIVEVRNQDGVVNNVRVTEQIISQDAAGEKSYPTVSSRLVITPGVWAAWDGNQQWADVDDSTHWGDLT